VTPITLDLSLAASHYFSTTCHENMNYTLEIHGIPFGTQTTGDSLMGGPILINCKLCNNLLSKTKLGNAVYSKHLSGAYPCGLLHFHYQ
jgi:hypothetical protein